jgi:hypothetical protein
MMSPSRITPTFSDRQVAVLEREADRILSRAEAAGVVIDYLGIQPLFEETRGYAGPDSDWVLAPARNDPMPRVEGTMLVPKAEADRLRQLADVGIDFREIYIAHEIEKGRLQLDAPASPSGLAAPGNALLPTSGARTIDTDLAQRVVGEVPIPAATVELSRRLGTTSGTLLTVVRGALPVAATIAAAPLLAAGAVIAAAGTAVVAAGTVAVGAAGALLDPIVLGAWTIDREARPGMPAAWFVLARWRW